MVVLNTVLSAAALARDNVESTSHEDFSWFTDEEVFTIAAP